MYDGSEVDEMRRLLLSIAAMLQIAGVAVVVGAQEPKTAEE